MANYSTYTNYTHTQTIIKKKVEFTEHFLFLEHFLPIKNVTDQYISENILLQMFKTKNILVLQRHALSVIYNAESIFSYVITIKNVSTINNSVICHAKCKFK